MNFKKQSYFYLFYKANNVKEETGKEETGKEDVKAGNPSMLPQLVV